MTDELFSLLRPVVDGLGLRLELFDVELRAGVLLVTVDRDDGVDLESLTSVNRAISAVLDHEDPIPGRYTLEVSSPGVERTLRTPDHFTRAVGSVVAVKTRPQVPGERRPTGTLAAADGEGFVLSVEGADEPLRLAYSDIDRARTVFVWGPTVQPGASKRHRGPAGAKTMEKKRKQATTS